jgi:hypothetical protein
MKLKCHTFYVKKFPQLKCWFGCKKCESKENLVTKHSNYNKSDDDDDDDDDEGV